MSQMKPVEFIETLRNSFAGSVQVYTMNSCYQLFLILKLIYPQAQCYWSIEKRHAITRIGADFYDITGHVQNTQGYFRMKKMNKEYTDSHFSIFHLVDDCRASELAYKMFKKSQLVGGNLTGHEIFTEIMNQGMNLEECDATNAAQSK